jgi:DNA-binding NarL/FixJ family response regulator
MTIVASQPALLQANTMRSLFIVDDSPLIIERLLGMLEGLLSPEQIGFAGSYGEALSIIDPSPPDILLLDVHLPDRSGVELLRVVRKRHPTTIVIMISNQSDESYRSVCAALGALRFLDKSTEFEEIPGLIMSLL